MTKIEIPNKQLKEVQVEAKESDLKKREHGWEENDGASMTTLDCSQHKERHKWQ